MRLTVRNETSFRTTDLKRLIRRAVRDDGVAGNFPELVVTVKAHRRATASRGRATIGGTHMWLWLGASTTPQRTLYIIAHELLHNRGLRHTDYGGDPGAHYLELADAAVPPLRHKAPRAPKPKPNVRLLRYQRALQHIAAKERALTRLQASLKKWHKKRRYYERVLAAASPPPGRAGDPQPHTK